MGRFESHNSRIKVQLPQYNRNSAQPRRRTSLHPCLSAVLDARRRGYRVDMLVAGTVVVEVKAVEHMAPVHEAQLLTYLRMGGWKAGLLINFNVAVFARRDHQTRA